LEGEGKEAAEKERNAPTPKFEQFEENEDNDVGVVYHQKFGES